MEIPTVRWIEIEPGAPLPPEVPPWATRYDRVERPSLFEKCRPAVLAAGATLLAGGFAVALLASEFSGLVDVFVAGVVIAGIALLIAGLMKMPPVTRYVPSAAGRYVLTEPVPRPATQAAPPRAAGPESAGMFERLLVRVFGNLAAVLLLTFFVAMFLAGDRSVESAKIFLPLLPIALPSLIDAARRRMKSEAELSDQFLRAADPRVALPVAAAPSQPAAGEVAAGEGEERDRPGPHALHAVHDG